MKRITAFFNRLFHIHDGPIEIKFRDPNGEEAVVISKRLFRDTLAEAYEMGATDQDHGNADKTFRDAYVESVCEDLAI